MGYLGETKLQGQSSVTIRALKVHVKLVSPFPSVDWFFNNGI